MRLPPKYLPLLIALAALIVLPFALLAARPHADHRDRRRDLRHRLHGAEHPGRRIPGLVSFGHGAFFGLAAYAAALAQRHWFPGDDRAAGTVRARRRRGVRVARRLSHPAPARRLFLAADARALGRCCSPSRSAGRRSPAARAGSAASCARPCSASISARPWIYYWLVAAIGLAVTYRPLALPSLAVRPRAGRDPRERAARALHRLPDRPLQAARLHDLRDDHRRGGHALGVPSPLRLRRSDFGRRSPANLLAMVVIGGMRSFLGPALGALFFILFREFLSIWTPNWLLYFGLLFVGFIVFSPTGLVGVGERVFSRRSASAWPMPPRCRRARSRAMRRCRACARRPARSRRARADRARARQASSAASAPCSAAPTSRSRTARCTR